VTGVLVSLALGVAAPAGAGASNVYVSNSGSGGSVSVFSIGAGGVLAPLACVPATNCLTGGAPLGVAIDPSAAHLYVADSGSGSVSGFSIGAGGVLTPIACVPATSCQTEAGPVGIAVDPSGSYVYVTNLATASVSVFSIGAGGALSPVACDPTTICKTGNADIFSLAVSPDRGPVAAFSAGAGPSGSMSLLDGSTSSSPDYAIASYVWEFGDGQTLTSALPAVQHVYAKPGSYSVTLTVTDQAGCALSVVYTGQTASCNGSAKARATRTITVPSPVLPLALMSPIGAMIGKESISPSAFPANPGGPSAVAAKRHKRRYGAQVTYTLNVAAGVRFTVQLRSDGRRVKHAKTTTCDRPTKHNRAKRKCIRYVTLAGSFTQAGLAGTNKFRFSGRLNGKRLSPGNYRLIATPTPITVTSRAATANFRIIP
jgi:PKD repeat protein